MKRDMELVRSILLAIENHPEAGAPDTIMNTPGYSEGIIEYHLALLLDADLIKGTEDVMLDDSLMVTVQRMTWAGHEFLEAAREDTRWKKAMRVVADKGGAMTFDVLKALLVSFMKNAVGLEP